MGPLQRFLEYAQDFEKTFDDDDWKRLERYFARDAVYEVRNAPFACRLEGRAAILRGLKKSIDGFDRRLSKRSLEVTEAPKQEGDTITVGWAATYRKPGAPALVGRGRTTARFEGDLIVELRDEYPDGAGAAFQSWTRAHAPGLDASYV
jgi:hypothetical protein